MRRLTTTIALALATFVANAQPADSAELLVQRWEQAMSAKDVKAYQSLFVSADPKAEAATVGQFNVRVGMKRGAVKVLPFSTYEKMYSTALQRGAEPVVIQAESTTQGDCAKDRSRLSTALWILASMPHERAMQRIQQSQFLSAKRPYRLAQGGKTLRDIEVAM